MVSFHDSNNWQIALSIAQQWLYELSSSTVTQHCSHSSPCYFSFSLFSITSCEELFVIPNIFLSGGFRTRHCFVGDIIIWSCFSDPRIRVYYSDPMDDLFLQTTKPEFSHSLRIHDPLQPPREWLQLFSLTHCWRFSIPTFGSVVPSLRDFAHDSVSGLCGGELHILKKDEKEVISIRWSTIPIQGSPRRTTWFSFLRM